MNEALLPQIAAEPLAFQRLMWPDVTFYDKQIEVINSVRDNNETVVVAGHQLGKDYVAGFIVLWYFITHWPCRIVTTSVKDDHLRVLWGEMGRYIDNARLPLDRKKGGPLVLGHREVKRVYNGRLCKISYLIGQVSEKGEGMAGHHAPHTLLVVDEASGVSDMIYERGSTWAKKMLIFGNPYPARGNFFERMVKGGDVKLQPTGENMK